MSDAPRQKRLTLSQLQAIDVPDATGPRTGSVPAVGPRTGAVPVAVAPSDAPQATPPGGVEAVPDTSPAFRVDARQHLPEGVSPEVASLLGMPSREEAERAAAARESAARAAAAQAERDAREAQLAAERAAAEAERARVEAELERTRTTAAQTLAQAQKKSRVSAVVAASVAAIVVAGAAVALTRPPVVDVTPFTPAMVAVSQMAHAQFGVGFNPIPPPPVIEAPPEAPQRSAGPRRREVRRTDLF